MRRRILLIEDEPGLVVTLGDRLESEGYDVDAVSDGQSGYDCAVGGTYDAIVLDLMLPKKSGLDICRELRARGWETPILMLTAKGQLVDKVVGLKLGADDYVTKPFEMVELLARLEALLRRSPTGGHTSSDAFVFGAVRVDFRSAEVKRGGSPVELSAREYKLLSYFIEHRGAALSRDDLLKGVWGYDAMPLTRTVDVHVAYLRQKLEPNPRRPRHIVTVHGLGYKFVT